MKTPSTFAWFGGAVLTATLIIFGLSSLLSSANDAPSPASQNLIAAPAAAPNAKLFAPATGGGDEYCGQVIQASTNELQWDDSDKTIKLIYIAGNETFHQGDVKAKDALVEARAKGIVVNTIF